jgi:hypothetical protein
MARLEKYTTKQLPFQLNHNTRNSPKKSSNEMIDPSRSHLNRGWGRGDDLAHFKNRLEQLHVHNRKDVNTALEWVVTQPQDLAENDSRRFFDEVYNFLNNRYGGKDSINMINATVHMDESTPHLHYLFVPAVANPKGHGGKAERVCAKALITKRELLDFHPALQKHLNAAGIKCSVVTGKSQGRSVSLKEYKQLKATERTLAERERQLDERERQLVEREHAREHERERAQQKGVFLRDR